MATCQSMVTTPQNWLLCRVIFPYLPQLGSQSVNQNDQWLLQTDADTMKEKNNRFVRKLGKEYHKSCWSIQNWAKLSWAKLSLILDPSNTFGSGLCRWIMKLWICCRVRIPQSRCRGWSMDETFIGQFCQMQITISVFGSIFYVDLNILCKWRVCLSEWQIGLR